MITPWENALPSVSTLTTADPALLVQFSDSHLFAEADGALLGMNTRDSLQKVIELVRAQQPQIDLILATGDLSQDGTLASYQQFREMTRQIDAPARWIPGNHDEPQIMAQAAVQSALLEPVVDIGNWRVTMLDSAVPGSAPGYLQDEQLQLLARSLSEAPERHHLVCFHHHPVPIGCAWMEPIGLRNPRRFSRCWTVFAQVRAVLWGHVHQEIDHEAQRRTVDRLTLDLHSVRAGQSRISRSGNRRRGIAGCGCCRMGGWKPVLSGSPASTSLSITAPTATEN